MENLRVRKIMIQDFSDEELESMRGGCGFGQPTDRTGGTDIVCCGTGTGGNCCADLNVNNTTSQEDKPSE